MSVSFFLRRKTKWNFAHCFAFTHVYRILKLPFCRKSPISTGRKSRLKPGEFMNLIRCIGNKTVFNVLDLILMFSNAGPFYSTSGICRPDKLLQAARSMLFLNSNYFIYGTKKFL